MLPCLSRAPRPGQIETHNQAAMMVQLEGGSEVPNVRWSPIFEAHPTTDWLGKPQTRMTLLHNPRWVLDVYDMPTLDTKGRRCVVWETRVAVVVSHATLFRLDWHIRRAKKKLLKEFKKLRAK